MANLTAPTAATAAQTAHATVGGPVPFAGTPVVAAAIRTNAATPTAVPSWAQELTIPEAAPRHLSSTLVPSSVHPVRGRPP